MTPMEIDGPYIIVDNQKLQPIGRLPQQGSAADDRPGREAQPFGVVDRVTISTEARQQLNQPQGTTAKTSPSLDLYPKKTPATSPLLTYSVKQIK